MRNSLFVLAFAVLLSTGCGNNAPTLPPEESMAVSLSSLSGSSTADDAGVTLDAGTTADGGVTTGTHKNWTNAAVRVGLLDAWVVLGLAPEVAVFHAARSQHPKAQGKQWVWTSSVNDGFTNATATLTAELDGTASVWTMTIDGRVGAEQFSKFLWYEGRAEVSTGYWQIYNKAGKLVRIDWTVNAPADRQLKFTNNTGGADDGAWLQYKLLSDAASVSYDFKTTKKADIDWSVATRAGSMTAADYAGHENQKVCWDGQLFDATCP
jgi:hypothetical protein